MSGAILVIEDEPLVRDLVAFNLQHAGYAVQTVTTFADGLSQLLQRERYALAIVDVMLPGGDGIELVRRVRQQGISTPVLLLTARGESTTKVRGFDVGADDYVTKPFDVPELLARVRALLRRASGDHGFVVGGGGGGGAPRFEFGGGRYWIRFDSGLAQTNEGEVTLSDKELRLLEQLVRQEDRVLSRADLLEEVWGMDAFPTERTIDNFVLRLRRLFEPDPESPVHLVTVRGRGYLFRRNP
ncbi:MAG: response regulator transcription factor [Deltaproteobacteria bacterium]|nr:response regulator transcription factor [Deltaproteobacteria bacterium]